MNMSTESLIIILLIGAIAGWLAGLVVRGFGFGIVGNIVIGIVGAFVGTWLLGRLGVVIGTGFVPAIFNAFIGALIVLGIIGLIKRA